MIICLYKTDIPTSDVCTCMSSLFTDSSSKRNRRSSHFRFSSSSCTTNAPFSLTSLATVTSASLTVCCICSRYWTTSIIKMPREKRNGRWGQRNFETDETSEHKDSTFDSVYQIDEQDVSIHWQYVTCSDNCPCLKVRHCDLTLTLVLWVPTFSYSCLIESADCSAWSAWFAALVTLSRSRSRSFRRNSISCCFSFKTS